MPEQLLALDRASAVRTRFTFHIFNAVQSWNTPAVGALRGVMEDPIFASDLNVGMSNLTLRIDHYPNELTLEQLIRVDYPDGSVAGYWKYQQFAIRRAEANEYNLTLSALVTELSDIDLNGNYSSDATQPGTPLGPATFDVPVINRLGTTPHLTVGSILNNGTAYAYVYNAAKLGDAVSQAITFGGAGWWWFVDAMGVLDIRNTSPFTHRLTVGSSVVAEDWNGNTNALYNVFPVEGGQPAGATAPLSYTAIDTNPANAFSVPNIGRRVAPTYKDTSLLTQAAVNAVANSMLAFAERVSSTRQIELFDYALPGRPANMPVQRVPRPGDAVVLREPNPDPTSGGPYAVLGPWLVTKVTQYGNIGHFVVEVQSDMIAPPKPMSGNPSQDAGIRSLLSNLPSTALSPDGSAGHISNAVISGVAGAVGTPGAPTGLSVSTAIDNVAQTNNAYATVTWTPNVATDVPTEYEVQYQKAGDTSWSALFTGSASLKVPGLIQGFSYSFRVRTYNDINVAGPWSGVVTVTTVQDTIAPPVPSGLAVIATFRGALVAWTGLSGSTAADLRGYTLQVSLDGGTTWTTIFGPAADGTSYYYTAPGGTVVGTSMQFRVAAVDQTGNQSAWSATVSVALGQVSSTDLGPGSVTANALAAASVATAAIQSGAVTATQVAAAAIGTAAIQNAAITTALIQAAAITNALIANAAVGTAQIQDLAVTSAKVNDLVADKITAGNLTVYMTIAALGGLRTAASGRRIELTNSGIFGYDGTTTDYGFGPGVTLKQSTVDGTIQAKGTLTAGLVQSVLGASSTVATLNAALTNGTVYTAITVQPLAYPLAAGTVLTLNPQGSPTMSVTVGTAAAPGATNVAINSFTANGAYTVGMGIGAPHSWLDLSVAQALIANDGVRNRFQAGKLPSGNYGVQALDSTGNAIFDTDGLMQVMSVLSNYRDVSNSTNYGQTTDPSGYVTIATGPSFTLSRPVRVLAIAIVSGQYSSTDATNGLYGNTYGGMAMFQGSPTNDPPDDNGGDMLWQPFGSGQAYSNGGTQPWVSSYSLCTQIKTYSLAAGSYTPRVRLATSGSPYTSAVNFFRHLVSLQIFALGK